MVAVSINNKYCSFCDTDHPLTEEFWYSKLGNKRKDSENRSPIRYVCRVQTAQNTKKYAPRRASLNAAATTRYSNFIGKTIKREISCSLSYDDFLKLNNSPCYYCKGQLTLTGYNIDRKDSSEGYTLENSVPCCWVCNKAKSVQTEAEFAKWILSVAAWAETFLENEDSGRESR